jgi:hypothetical protein
MKSIVVYVVQQNQLKELHEASSKIQGADHSPSLSRADIYLAAICGRDFGFCRDSAEAHGELERGSQTVAGRAPPTYLNRLHQGDLFPSCWVLVLQSLLKRERRY